MIRFAADENFNNDIVRGILRRRDDVDVVRIQDVGLSGASDEAVLEWAAGAGRILLTHDVKTLAALAIERVRLGKRMPGVVEVARGVPIGVAIDDIELLALCSGENEWDDRVLYLPLR